MGCIVTAAEALQPEVVDEAVVAHALHRRPDLRNR